MSVGSRFQMCGAANTKARLPTVDSLTSGSTRRLELIKHSVRLPGWSWTRMSGLWCMSVKHFIRHNIQFVQYSLRNPQPVETDECISYIFAGLQMVDKSSRRIQDRLEVTHQVKPEGPPAYHYHNPAGNVTNVSVRPPHLKSGRQYRATDLA